MLAAKLTLLSLAAASLAPCDPVASDAGTGTAADTGAADTADAPVVDDVTLPQTVAIDSSTGVAHVIGSISFHDDFGSVVGVNVLADGTHGSVYRGPLDSQSPQPLIFDLSTPGVRVLDFNVFDQAGHTSAAVARPIAIQ